MKIASLSTVEVKQLWDWKWLYHSMIKGTYQKSKEDRGETFVGWSGMLQRPQKTIAGNPMK